jgi:hypothetical protein
MIPETVTISVTGKSSNLEGTFSPLSPFPTNQETLDFTNKVLSTGDGS